MAPPRRPLAEGLARLPTDRHVHYSVDWQHGRPYWLARWRDDEGRRRACSLGHQLPTERPDHPCQHTGKLWPWCVPTTDAERQEAIERGRRANAARKVRSNQHLKRLEQAEEARRLAAQESGRKGNAARKVHSNKWIKMREKAS